MEDRKQRQIEYEARVAKREAKAASLEASRSRECEDRRTETNNKKEKETASTGEEHPSWIAKRLAEEKLQKAKFEGKKIKFD